MTISIRKTYTIPNEAFQALQTAVTKKATDVTDKFIHALLPDTETTGTVYYRNLGYAVQAVVYLAEATDCGISVTISPSSQPKQQPKPECSNIFINDNGFCNACGKYHFTEFFGVLRRHDNHPVPEWDTGVTMGFDDGMSPHERRGHIS